MCNESTRLVATAVRHAPAKIAPAVTARPAIKQALGLVSGSGASLPAVVAPTVSTESLLPAELRGELHTIVKAADSGTQLALPVPVGIASPASASEVARVTLPKWSEVEALLAELNRPVISRHDQCTRMNRLRIKLGLKEENWPNLEANWNALFGKRNVLQVWEALIALNPAVQVSALPTAAQDALRRAQGKKK